VLALAGERGTRALDLGERAARRGGLRRLRLRTAGATMPCAESGRLSVPGAVGFGGGRLSAERGRFPVRDGSLSARSLIAPLESRRGGRATPCGRWASAAPSRCKTSSRRQGPRDAARRVPVVRSAGEIAWIPAWPPARRSASRAPRGEHVRLSWTPPVYD
jgi:hypothetical protein